MPTTKLGSLVAGLATTALIGAGGSAPAVAGGGDHDDAVVIGLTDRTVDRLTAGRNVVRALGAAEKDVHDGDVYLAFPVKGGDDRDDHHRRTDGDRDVARLAGTLAVTGAGPDATWSKLRVDLDRGVITAIVNGGDRAQVLKVADRSDDEDHDGRYRRGGYGVELDLTRAGARSLNRAVVGSPFSAGTTFAGDSDGCR